MYINTNIDTSIIMRDTGLHQYLNLLSKEQLKSGESSTDDDKITPDNSTLGLLFAYAVSTISKKDSPASLDHSIRNNNNLTDELKKRFQKTCRNVFQCAAQKYQLNGHTAAQFERKYTPEVASWPAQEKVEYFTEGSLEKMVLQLTQKGKFEELGQALKEGAQAYHKLAERKGMPHYRILTEYNAIQKALSEKVKEL